jgi:hypothetical protein
MKRESIKPSMNLTWYTGQVYADKKGGGAPTQMQTTRSAADRRDHPSMARRINRCLFYRPKNPKQ